MRYTMVFLMMLVLTLPSYGERVGGGHGGGSHGGFRRGFRGGFVGHGARGFGRGFGRFGFGRFGRGFGFPFLYVYDYGYGYGDNFYGGDYYPSDYYASESDYNSHPSSSTFIGGDVETTEFIPSTKPPLGCFTNIKDGNIEYRESGCYTATEIKKFRK
jgi:hypothetical protein